VLAVGPTVNAGKSMSPGRFITPQETFVGGRGSPVTRNTVDGDGLAGAAVFCMRRNVTAYWSNSGIDLNNPLDWGRVGAVGKQHGRQTGRAGK